MSEKLEINPFANEPATRPPSLPGREAVGRAIYLAMYEHKGGKWEANEAKDVWYDMADRFFAILSLTKGTGEAGEAVPNYEFPYQQTFDAICAAIDIHGVPKSAGVSVRKFQEAFNSHRDKRALTPVTDVGRVDRLQNERSILDNSFGGGAFHDGMVRQRIETIDAELAALSRTPSND